MLTVVIKNDGEDKVNQLTYENIWYELKDIPDAELIIAKDWFYGVDRITTKFVCFVEADCLLSKDYFKRQLKEFKLNPGRKISMLTSKTGVKQWEFCFYGYDINDQLDFAVIPNKKKKSNLAYPVEVGYLPGALIRTSMLKEALENLDIKGWDNLVYLSTILSLAFWRQGANNLDKKIQNGNPVYINPRVAYVTTEDYVNDIGKFDFDSSDLVDKFAKESI